MYMVVASSLPERSRCMQEKDSLVELAQQRCRDDKAPVRKAAVQLLEQLLLQQPNGSSALQGTLCTFHWILQWKY